MEIYTRKRLTASDVQSLVTGIQASNRIASGGGRVNAGPLGSTLEVRRILHIDPGIMRVGDSDGVPFIYKTTAAPAAGTVTAKRVNSSGTVQGSNFSFTVL